MLRKSKKISYALLNLIGFIAVIAVNTLAMTLPINNITTGEVSDKYPNLFVPAGITFSIWGVIYLFLALFIIYQFVIPFKKSTGERGIFEKTGLLFFLSCIFNVSWIFAWHYGIVWLSLAIMILLLITLISIYVRLKTGRAGIKNHEKFFVNIPFSLYLGWITVATIANVTAFLVDINWDGFGISEQLWAVILIAAALIITLLTLLSRNDIFYSLVVIWAFTGIILKRIADTGTSDNAIVITSIASIAILALLIIIQLVRKKKVY